MRRLAELLSISAIAKGTIAMYKHNGSIHPNERDRVGRILAHKRAVAVRVARQFDEPNSALAREVRDILEHMPEHPVRVRKVGA